MRGGGRRAGLWAVMWYASLWALPAGAAVMTPIETLTCRAFAAEVAAFDTADPGRPRSEMPRYKAVIALMREKLPGSGAREVAAALDDTLVDCAAAPEAKVLDLLAKHRITADRWRE